VQHTFEQETPQAPQLPLTVMSVQVPVQHS
jgi:hypothetical protein